MRKMIYRAGTGSVAAIKGHPLHPMLVPVVIGAFSAAVIADLMNYARPDPFWAKTAMWLLLLTLVSGIVAAIPGLIDLVFVRRARALSTSDRAAASVARALLARARSAAAFCE
jgi:uncharacterized membrane protein